MEENKMKVVAQKVDPQAVITKYTNGKRKGFQSTCINILENGTERTQRISSSTKRDLVKTLSKLPVNNVIGMEVDIVNGWSSVELFSFNGVMEAGERYAV